MFNMDVHVCTAWQCCIIIISTWHRLPKMYALSCTLVGSMYIGMLKPYQMHSSRVHTII